MANTVYKAADREWAANLLARRSENDESGGEIVETLLNFLFGAKEMVGLGLAGN